MSLQLLALSTPSHKSTQVRVSTSSRRHDAECLRASTAALPSQLRLRLLGAQESTDILNAAEEHLRYEDVYVWLTDNYLLNMICPDSPVGIAPYAVLDLGGGSTQIVFKPDGATREDVG
ncbi:hypothetical protein J3A83DRAFT_4410352 [Scleroderma citrinum]